MRRRDCQKEEVKKGGGIGSGKMLETGKGEKAL